MYEGGRRSRSFFHRISVAGKKEENCSGRNRLQHSSIFSFSFFSVVTLVSKRGRRLPYKTNICRDHVHAMHYSAPSLVQRFTIPSRVRPCFVSFDVCSFLNPPPCPTLRPLSSRSVQSHGLARSQGGRYMWSAICPLAARLPVKHDYPLNIFLFLSPHFFSFLPFPFFFLRLLA